MKKIFIAGNITIDNYPLLNRGNESEVYAYFESMGIKIVPKRKQEITFLREAVEKIKKKATIIRRAGGGAYNSVVALSQKLERGTLFDYYDLSPAPSKVKLIGSVNYHFQRLSGLTEAIAIENAERAILKTKRDDGQTLLTEEEIEELKNLMRGSDFIVINSLGNPIVAREISRERGAERYITITKSLNLEDLAVSGILRDAFAVLDIEESDILGIEPRLDKPHVKSIILKLLELGAKKAVLTLGKEGAIFGDRDSNHIQWCRVKEKTEEKVETHIEECRIRKTGTGDYFLSCLLIAQENLSVLEQVVKKAQEETVREKLGYLDIREEDFETTII